MIKRNLQLFGWVITVILFITGCGNEQRNIDISETNVNVDIYRFDEFLNANNPIDKTTVDNFEKEFPEFSKAFNQAILRPGNQPVYLALQNFQSYFDSIGVNRLIEKRYGTINQLEAEYIQMQQRVKAIFPEYKPIGLITMNSGFNYKNFLLNEHIAVGLDMYLGDSVDYVQMGTQFPQYKLETFQEDYILPDAATTILQDFIPDNPEENQLLDRMIYNGKLLWLQELILPGSQTNQLISLTGEEFEWLEENERDIWRYFISRELLYSTDYGRFKTYISDGPFSDGMPEGAPANTGSYIGWQIIRQYARKFPDMDIREIIEQGDSQKILNDSGYSP